MVLIKNWGKNNRIKALNPKSILEAGCGTGIVLTHFKAKGIKLYGLELYI